MTLTRTLSAALLALGLATPSFAEILVEDAYARSSGAMGRSGAAFMVIRNTGAEDDRLVAATSDISQRVELHTHKETDDGVMRMMEVEEGFPIPAGGMHALARGGDHVMFMGLNEAMEQGDTVTVTLTFEKAGDMELEIPVDLERMDGHGMGHGGGMGHGNGGGMGQGNGGGMGQGNGGGMGQGNGGGMGQGNGGGMGQGNGMGSDDS
jgi:copper(I)-binding protein